jgi:ornithine cyclodeaminase/alanine dehydrogenase-like protein (mu-crystallin family)
MSDAPPNASLPLIDADEVFSRLGFGEAVRAIQDALTGGLDPALDAPRQIVDVAGGQILLMPSERPDHVGVKVATIAPGNPAIGKERIQGIYLLMDAASLSPLALLDGTALTTLRTPAVSAAAADYLAPAEVDHLVVFGSGPQAWGHIEAIRAIRAVRRVSVVGRSAAKAQALADRVSAAGLQGRVGVAGDVADAQVVVCATTASEPLFDGRLVPDDSCTIAVGSHEPGIRELDGNLLGRAQVVVEDTATALLSAGNVVMAIGEGLLDPASLVPLRDLVTGAARADLTRPRVFTSVGMSWQDLVVASAVHGRPSA